VLIVVIILLLGSAFGSFVYTVAGALAGQ
jgi:hypothetical protein